MLPAYKFFAQHANRESLIDILYINTLDDIIFCHDKTNEQVHDICAKAVDEIIELCKGYSKETRENEGYLSILTCGTMDEICVFTDNDKYDVMLSKWDEWLNYPVSDKVDPEKFCIAMLLTMTFCGFTQESQAKRTEEINEDLIRSIEKFERNPKTYTREDMDEMLKDMKDELKEEEQE